MVQLNPCVKLALWMCYCWSAHTVKLDLLGFGIWQTIQSRLLSLFWMEKNNFGLVWCIKWYLNVSTFVIVCVYFSCRIQVHCLICYTLPVTASGCCILISGFFSLPYLATRSLSCCHFSQLVIESRVFECTELKFILFNFIMFIGLA